MSSVNGYEHDVFISYATVDDYPAKCGWVSAFVRSLSESLASNSGSRDPDRIWWDRSNIDEEALLTEQIRTKVQKSVCMVVILSQGYSKSKWCRQERETFLAAVAGQPEADRRLFLIDIGNLDPEQRPHEFRDKRGRHFFVQPPNTTGVADRERLGFPTPDPENKDHKAFFTQIEQLARDLCARMAGWSATKPVAPSYPDITLFVAEAADDVAEEREEVVRFLSDHFHVLPAIDDPLPNRWDQWQSAVDAGLNASALFVQVLGELPGRKIVGSEQKPVIAQFEKAKAAGKRLVLWRRAAVGPESVSDDRMNQLLAAAEYGGPLEEFKSEIKRLATPSKLLTSEVRSADILADQPRVFINTGIEDYDQARLLSERLKAMGCRCLRPLLEGSPEDLRDDFGRQVQSCDGLIVFYGQIKPVWVRRQFDSMERHLTYRAKKKLRALAVCLGAPPKSTDLGIDWPGLEVIDGTSGFVEEQLHRWVATLRNGGGA